MRAGATYAARLALLGGATVLAFFAGGYFDEPRAWAGLIAWLLVVIAFVLVPGAVPRARTAWLALGGLALLAAWTLASIGWAPIVGNAYHAGQLVVLYAGVLLAGAILFRAPAASRMVEPGLAAGALIVIGYGISERLLPGALHFARSVSAQGRLEQPLTYWNAMGELAALGFVLCARIAGDRTRPRSLGAAAAAAGAPLGMGLYISFSRGALFACAAGLLALLVAAPRREQLEGIALTAGAGALAALGAAPFKGVTSLAGSLGAREREGAIVFALLALIMALVATLHRLLGRRGVGEPLRLPRHAPWIAVAVICAGLALAIVAGAKEGTNQRLSSGASRFVTLQSNRYAYWDVALRAFSSQPLRGVGAGGWSVWWLRYRTINDFAQDAHSLPLQTLAELGLVGVLLLGAFVTGVALAAQEARGLPPAAAAGPIAALVTYAAHAPLDWDWQMPAVTIVALLLAGELLALAELRTRSRAPARAGAPAGP